MHDDLGAAAISIKGLWEPIVIVQTFDYWHLPTQLTIQLVKLQPILLFFDILTRELPIK